jgi:nucleoid-associated protein YgaU
MTRHVWPLLGLSVLVLAGCENKNQEASAHLEEPYLPAQHASLDSMDAATAPETTATTELPLEEPVEFGQGTPPPQSAEPAEDELLTPVGGRVYDVQKGDTLYALARQFYNDQTRWRDIWEANKTRLPDPDKLQIGMKLIIP